MKSVFINLINRGRYSLAEILRRIDTYHAEGKLTDAEREELYSMAREHADYTEAIDVASRFVEIDFAIRELQKVVSSIEDSLKAIAESVGMEVPDTGVSDKTYPEYASGKWYYADDRVTFENERYVCVAPEGQVCTWSPVEYPAYWSKVE